jgi:hypothetical protein
MAIDAHCLLPHFSRLRTDEFGQCRLHAISHPARDSFEDLPTAVNRCTPPDEELCQRCAQLFEEERRRRLGQVYSLLIDLARRRAAEKRAEDGETTAG